MKSIAVITTTFAPDFELCIDLHRSVLEFTDQSVSHYLLVPPADLELFSALRGPRCVVLAESELLPSRMIRIPTWVNHLIQLAWHDRRRANLAAVNLLRPIPPVRGWILQQIVKLAAASRLDADILLIADSDVRIVRPISIDTFVREGKLRLYRREGTVNEDLPSHVAWHKVARKLLGLATPTLPLPDYVSSFNVWERRVVLLLLDRINRVSHRHWIDAIAGRLSFSEHILYGVFVDKVLGPSANTFTASASLCHSYWDTTPLDAAGAETFLQSVAAEDVAVLIQSKSGTPIDVRRSALDNFTKTVHSRNSWSRH